MRNKIKVLHIGSGYNKGGGGSKVLKDTVKLLQNECVNYLIAVDCEDTDFTKKIEGWNDYKGILKVLNLLFSIKQYRQITRWTRDKRFDVIHVQNYLSSFSPSILYFLKKQKKQGVRLVFTAHEYSGICANSCLYNYSKQEVCEKCVGSSFKFRAAFVNCDRRGRIYSVLKGIRSFIYYNLLGIKDLFDKVICVSEFQKNLYLKDGYSPEKLTVVQNPISEDFFLDQIPEKKKQILFYGRISPEKNIELLLRAFFELIRDEKLSDYKLIIVGDGESSYKKILEKLTEDLGVEDNVVWKKSMPQNEIAQLISESMLTVQPAKWYETFGLTVVESLLAGTPCLASNIGAVGETAKQFGGYVFTANNRNSLIEAVKTILNNYPEEFDSFLEKRQYILVDIRKANSAYKNRLLEIYSEESKRIEEN